MSLGIWEIFFGSPWPKAERLAYADFMQKHGFGFYLYAPKADKNLRKEWRKEWSAEYLAELKELSATFRSKGLRFGVALSPFEFHKLPFADGEKILRQKLALLDSIGIDDLGLFFDDMPVHDGLAESQIKILRVVCQATRANIIFCPSFYSPDPILEKVFGKCPEYYLEELAMALPSRVQFAWTGPKVISDTIPPEHLRETTKLLGRLPFICDNLFANDGPKNCKFLKLRVPAGRPAASFEYASGWALNMMNQPNLSKICALSMKYACDGHAPERAFDMALEQICSLPLVEFIRKHLHELKDEGLDKIDKEALLAELQALHEPCAQEIKSWLRGEYTVGSECLTD